jgi:hypothetical protein
MKAHFPSEDGCFINKNYRLLQRYSAGQHTLNEADTLKMLEEVHFGGLSKFNQLYMAPESNTRRLVKQRCGPGRVSWYEIL